MGFVWVLVPLTAILVGAFREYLKFQENQARLGASTDDLEKNFDALKAGFEKENQTLVRRIQNLEAIVTSQAWDDSHALDVPSGVSDSDGRIRFDPEPVEPTDEERAEKMARRMRQ